MAIISGDVLTYRRTNTQLNGLEIRTYSWPVSERLRGLRWLVCQKCGHVNIAAANERFQWPPRGRPRAKLRDRVGLVGESASTWRVTHLDG